MCGCIDSDKSDYAHPEVWEGDVADDEPLQEPVQENSSTQALTTLLQWLVYFLLLWQATCKTSDNWSGMVITVCVPVFACHGNHL